MELHAGRANSSEAAPEVAVLRTVSNPRIGLVTMDQNWVQLAPHS